MLKKGDRLKGISFTDSEGRTYALSDFKDRRAVVFFFYPADFSPFCTKQACYFRDYYGEIKELGGEVFGVNGGSRERHARFKEKHALPYPLIPDENGTLSRIFGVGRLGGLLGNKRVTFVIAPDGEVMGVIRSELNMMTHVEQVIGVLTKLKEQGK